MIRRSKLFVSALSFCIAALVLPTMTKAQTDVYVGGTSNGTRATIWKNGTPQFLTTGIGYVLDVLVDKDNVYAAGMETVSGKTVAKVWKNATVLYTLTDGMYDAEAHSIAVAGNNIYVAGIENSAGSVGKMWKNGVAEAGYSNAWALYSIFINASDVYAAGITTDFKAAVWKNGTLLYTLSQGSGMFHVAYSVVVDKGDVYTAGQEQTSNGDYTLKVWKNNTVLYTLETNEYPAFMKIFISNGVIYVSGSGESGGTKVAKLWTNGVGTNLSGGSNALAVFVSGSDVYVAGTENYSKALLWKNGTLTTLSSGSSDVNVDLANSIFVTGGGVSITEVTTTQIKVYPNPTNGKLKIENGELKIGNVEIYDIYGKKQLSIFNFQFSIDEIDISLLAKGMYFLKIDGKTMKIIKN